MSCQQTQTIKNPQTMSLPTSIPAKRITTTTIIYSEDAPMSSRSEGQEAIISEDSRWEYELPEGYQFFKTPSKEGISIPVIAEIFVGKPMIIGYASPVAYISYGWVYMNWQEFQNSPNAWDDFRTCRVEDIQATLDKYFPNDQDAYE